MALIVACGLPGCGGCSKKTTAKTTKTTKTDQRKKKKVKKKPNFESTWLATQPGGLAGERERGFYKPGHWTNAVVDFKANNFDFNGEVHSNAFDLPNSPFSTQTARPARLAKGQQRFVEMTVFVPPGRVARGGTELVAELTPKGGGRAVMRRPQALRAMREHQFYLVVLARSPDLYAYVDSLSTVTGEPPLPGRDERRRFYMVKRPPVKNRAPLPSHPLAWTSIAVLLWDEFDPTKLTELQRESLVDWLHWGGQLVISGPNSLDLLAGSFLDDYLPTTDQKIHPLAANAFDVLNSEWGKAYVEHRLPNDGWEGLQFEVADDPSYQFVPNTGELFVERPVGQGRIVVSAVGLSRQRLREWPGLDSLVNNVLLRRPGRTFGIQNPREFAEFQVRWSKDNVSRFDARPVSRLRYFSRDTGRHEVIRRDTDDLDINMDIDIDDRELVSGGVAGWDDTNTISQHAREALGNAAGIEVPDASLVVWVVGIYALVIGPLNWTVFRLLGRVEWAWIAAPLISIGFAAAVVYLAQLDIGFSRARTEIAVIELQPGYSRAHLTRYTAVYTSLGTRFDATFNDQSVLSQPFPTELNARIESRSAVEFRRGMTEDDESAVASLHGFTVPSSTTRMLHTEQMLDLGGAIQIVRPGGGPPRLVNATTLPLSGVAVVRRPREDRLVYAWIGQLGPGATSSPLTFVARSSAEWRSGDTITSQSTKIGDMNIQKLVELAEVDCKVGETRLVAWSEENFAGLEFSPSISRARQANLIVAHLEYAPLPAPDRDRFGRGYVSSLTERWEELKTRGAVLRDVDVDGQKKEGT